MWIIDKLFNRKIEGESSIDDLLEHVVQNGNKTEVGGSLEVDGDVKVNSNLEVNGQAFLDEITIEGFSKILDKDGHLIGKDLEDAVSGKNTITLTFTEDDYDEENDVYVKHIEVNNAFIEINTGNLSNDSTLLIYNPYFKGAGEFVIAGAFNGWLYEPQNRYLSITKGDLANRHLCIFNGYLTACYFEL